MESLHSSSRLVPSGIAVVQRRLPNAPLKPPRIARIQRERHSRWREAQKTEQAARREERLSRLVKEAIEGWKMHGSFVHILDRENLSEEDQEELARRVYRTKGWSEGKAVRFVEEWRGKK